MDRQEYIGDTVNFKCVTRSYKDKTKIKLPKEDRKVFKNTHEPIIDEYTWNITKQLRNNRKKPTRSGKKSISLCTLHWITDDVLQNLVLENIQKVVSYMKNFEDLFIKEQLAKSTQDENKSLKTRKNLNKQRNELLKLTIYLCTFTKIIYLEK